MSWLRQSVTQIGRGYAAVLRNDDLRRAQVAWGVANTAEWIFFVALGVFAYEEAGITGVGLVGLIRMVPAAAIAPLASALGDRYRRDRVVLGLFVAMGAAAAVAALVAFDEPSTAAIYALAAIQNVASTVSRSAEWALMPSLARTPGELIASNSSILTTQNIGTLAGPAIGGALLATTRPWVLFALAAGCYLVAAVYLVPIRLRSTGSKAAAEDVLRGLLAGFRVVRQDARTRLLVLLVAAQTATRGALNVFLVVAAITLLRAGESGVGFLTAALGAGGLVGAFGSVSITGRLAPPVAAGLVLWGAPLAGIAAFPHEWVALVLVAVIGIGDSVLDVGVYTLLQRLVPQAVLTRVLGLNFGLAMLATGIGSIVTTGLIDAFGVRPALVAVSLFLPAVTLVSWPALRAADAAAVVPTAELQSLDTVPMFTGLSLVAKEGLASSLQPLDVAPREVVIREGEVGDRFYLVVDGELDVSVRGETMNVCGPGDYFGEIALLRDVPRTATVTARSDARLYALERDRFLDAVTNYAAGHAPVIVDDVPDDRPMYDGAPSGSPAGGE